MSLIISLLFILLFVYPRQAFVEFENVEAATRAKTALHGADIYTGCCTLRVENARVRNRVLCWEYFLSNDIVHNYVLKPTFVSAFKR